MQLTAFKPAPAKSGLENAHVTARETGGREASAGGENGDFAGVELTRSCPETAPPCWEMQKVRTDEGWDFRYWW